jgi:hypothetical protein
MFLGRLEQLQSLCELCRNVVAGSAVIESLLGMGAPPFQFPPVEFKGSNFTHADSLATWSKI